MTDSVALQHRRLQRANVAIMREPRFALWSGFLTMGSVSVLPDTFTARTDGVNEEYSAPFLESLTDKEIVFVRLHEMLHKAFKHLYIYDKLHKTDPECANQACDYVINYLLWETDPKGEHISMPSCALFDHKYKGMNSKQVFDALRKKKQGQARGQGQGQGQSLDEHQWGKANAASAEERKAIEEKVEAATRQGMIAHARHKGSTGGGLYRALQDAVTPQVDWRDQLREYMSSIFVDKTTSSWRRVNRRFLSDDIYMPSLMGETMKDLVVAVDTSGSIGDASLAIFLTEIQTICDGIRPEKVHLLYWDTSVRNHEMYDRDNAYMLRTSTKPKGGGGTKPSCVAAYMHDKHITSELCIVLTDGHVGDTWGGPESDWDAPVLWCIIDNPDAVPAFGKAIHIKERT